MNTTALNPALTTYQAPYRAPLLASVMLVLTLLQGSSATLTLAFRSPFSSDLLITLVTVLWLAMYLTATAGLIATQGINWLTWTVRYRLPLVLLVAGTAFSTVWSVDAHLTIERSIHLIGTTLLALYIGFSLPLTRILRTSALTLGLLMLASVLSALFLPSLGLEDYQGQCGLITTDLIKEAAGTPENTTFFLCGPQGMYDFCLPQIEQLGVPRRKIRKELYGPPLDICSDPGWPKEIEHDHLFSISVKGGQTISAPAGAPLLVSLEKGGVVPPSICRSGECSMCRIKILSGKVFQPAGTPVRKSDHQYGYVHSCVSYPLEDLEILL